MKITQKLGAVVLAAMLVLGAASTVSAGFNLGGILGGVAGSSKTAKYFEGHPRPQQETRWQVYNPNGKFKIWGKVVYPDGSDAANVDFILATDVPGQSGNLNVVALQSAYSGKTDAKGMFSVTFNGGFQVNVFAWKDNLMANSTQTNYTGATPVLMELKKTDNGKPVAFRHIGDHT